MMYIICDTNPIYSAKYLIKNSNKNFVFKQLLELCQLICSSGISTEYKAINQGKELAEFVHNYPSFTLLYAQELYNWCLHNVNLSSETIFKINRILSDLELFSKTQYQMPPSYFIFRYKKGYKSDYETNCKLPCVKAVDEYKKYLKWKFQKVEV